MKKKITSVLVAVLCCLALTIPVFTVNVGATSTLPRLVDDAQILKDSEKDFLLGELDSISEEYECDIVIVTIDSLEGESVVAYADDFFDYNGYGYGTNRDGILLLLSVEDREYAMSTSGYGIDVFTDNVLYHMEEKFLPHFADNNFYSGFCAFTESCEFYLEQDAYPNDDSYNYNDSYSSTDYTRKSFSPIYIPVAIIISAVIAITTVNIMKSGLTSVHKQKSATNYVRSGSMKIRNQRESYLYNHVSKIRRETQSSSSSSHRSSSSRGRSTTHRSSSGRRHGGSSGRF